MQQHSAAKVASALEELLDYALERDYLLNMSSQLVYRAEAIFISRFAQSRTPTDDLLALMDFVSDERKYREEFGMWEQQCAVQIAELILSEPELIRDIELGRVSERAKATLNSLITASRVELAVYFINFSDQINYLSESYEEGLLSISRDTDITEKIRLAAIEALGTGSGPRQNIRELSDDVSDPIANNLRDLIASSSPAIRTTVVLALGRRGALDESEVTELFIDMFDPAVDGNLKNDACSFLASTPRFRMKLCEQFIHSQPDTSKQSLFLSLLVQNLGLSRLSFGVPNSSQLEGTLYSKARDELEKDALYQIRDAFNAGRESEDENLQALSSIGLFVLEPARYSRDPIISKVVQIIQSNDYPDEHPIHFAKIRARELLDRHFGSVSKGQ